jgi:hypothetical protein
MGVRRIRKDRIAADQKVSRKENGILKVKERARRDARMLGIVKAKKLPYLPAVMSWLSAKLDKPSRLIAQADVDQLVASVS